MRKILLPLVLLAGIVHSCTQALDEKEKVQEVNSVLGDASFVSKYGEAPDETTDEDLRISTHLEFVENLLRAKNTAGLTEEQKAKRSRMLDLLHQYRTIGIFPRNYDHKERTPCFIDKDGRICAVGYLVEKTAGREVAETINKDFKYAEIMEMNSQLLDDWITRSGLTKEECAMIQPGYGSPGCCDIGPTDPPNTITKQYAITSSVFSGINLSANVVNGVQIAKGSNNKAVAVVGLISGAGQILLGVSEGGLHWSGTNEKQKNLSMMNIGLGTTTMLLSTWNLLSNRKPRDKKTTLCLNSFEFNNQPVMAFTLTRRL